MKTLEITTPFHKQKVRKSQSTKKTPKKLTCTHTYTLIHKDGDIKLYIQKRERYIHAYTTQETHKIHKHIQKTHKETKKNRVRKPKKPEILKNPFEKQENHDKPISSFTKKTPKTKQEAEKETCTHTHTHTLHTKKRNRERNRGYICFIPW